MEYKINQEITFNSLDGKKHKAKIIARKEDFQKGSTRTPNASGNYDYLITYEENGKIEQKFCIKKYLE
jgi:hypothetical protein